MGIISSLARQWFGWCQVRRITLDVRKRYRERIRVASTQAERRILKARMKAEIKKLAESVARQEKKHRSPYNLSFDHCAPRANVTTKL